MPDKDLVYGLIAEAIQDGIKVQEFLWKEINLNKKPYQLNKDVWKSVFQKRVDKISEINFNNPSAIIELRKRLLQQACLSIQALAVLDNTEFICSQSQNETESIIVSITK